MLHSVYVGSEVHSTGTEKKQELLEFIPIGYLQKKIAIGQPPLEDWDSALTKADAISLFLEMATNYTNNVGNTWYSQYHESTTDASSSETLSESVEIMQSKWADINGAWDAEHQYTLYAKSQGADYTIGWCWVYEHGKAAGDQPSYAVYMKENSPDYGKVFHVGDYLLIGTQLSGTNDEWDAFIAEDMIRRAKEEGLEVTEEDGAYVIHIK